MCVVFAALFFGTLYRLVFVDFSRSINNYLPVLATFIPEHFEVNLRWRGFGVAYYSRWRRLHDKLPSFSSMGARTSRILAVIVYIHITEVHWATPLSFISTWDIMEAAGRCLLGEVHIIQGIGAVVKVSAPLRWRMRR